MYNKTILDNQLRIVTEYIPSKTVSVGIWIDVGSRDELPALNGIAHFVEHMLFKGTSIRDANEIAIELDSLGGMSNAFTSKENTCLYGTVLGAQVEQFVRLLSDLFLNSLYAESEIERECQVVLQEISMVDDTPEDQIHDLLASYVWHGHPLSVPVLGTAQTVSEVSAEKLRGFVGDHYTADRIVISAAGDIQHHDFVDMISRQFGQCRPAPQSISTVQTRIKPIANAPQAVVRPKAIEQAHVVFSAYTPPITDSGRYELALLNVLLGGNMSSRLFQELREQRGLAYSIYSFVDALSDCGSLSIYAGVAPQNVGEAMLMITEVVSALKKAISQDEVKRACDYACAGMYLASESTEARMSRLAKNELYLGRYFSLEEVDASLRAVAADRVRATAETIFSAPMMSVVLGPVE